MCHLVQASMTSKFEDALGGIASRYLEPKDYKGDETDREVVPSFSATLVEHREKRAPSHSVRLPYQDQVLFRTKARRRGSEVCSAPFHPFPSMSQSPETHTSEDVTTSRTIEWLATKWIRSNEHFTKSTWADEDIPRYNDDLITNLEIPTNSRERRKIAAGKRKAARMIKRTGVV
ncbi:hypothetical protein HYALB_00012997 [Hymenoscyphus albidus]|uniref:Uncharacterized protein n=1 Tax=Hymenoscyphus albidus TaxID=595503 RepID=A0A9N9LNK8_9HELO|nr:hypothetical protein HYALB_00012997 [Hymenoscyphus albidus]